MNCERIKLSKTVYDMGMKVAAVSLMCQDDRVFQAMEMAGTPCPYMGKIGDEASLAWNTNAEERPDYRDNRRKINNRLNREQDAEEKVENAPRNEFIDQCRSSRNTRGKHGSLRASNSTCSTENAPRNEFIDQCKGSRHTRGKHGSIRKTCNKE